MRIAYSISLIILILLAVLFLIKNSKKSDHRTRFLWQVIAVSVPCMALWIIISWSQSYALSMICYTLYFIGLTWLVWFFLRFCMFYSENETKWGIVLTVLTCALLTASWLFNLKSGLLFSVSQMQWVTDSNYYMVLVPTKQFIWQMLPGYIMGGAMLIILTVRAFEAPRTYAPKYMAIVIMVVTILAIQITFVYFRLPMDWSVLFYAPFAMVTWYLATKYINTSLYSGTLEKIADRYDTGMVIFDYNDRCVYMNGKAQEITGANVSNCVDLLEKWYETRKASELEPHERELSFIRNNTKIWLSVVFSPLFDNDDYIGCYFALKDISEQVSKREEEHYKATHDTMTNLLNAEAFEKECRGLLDENPDVPFVMVRVETDAFESIGDIYGQDLRNAVISGMSSVIQKNLGDPGRAGRMGDAVFSILMPAEKFDGPEMLTGIRKMMLQIMGEKGRMFVCRIGVAEVDEPKIMVRTLINRSGIALSRIKNSDSQLSWYSSGMREQGILDSTLSGELPAAIRNRELRMYLQAELDNEGKLAGAEALVRWHRDGRVLVPAQFIPLFEKNEQIVDVDRYIWRQACECLRKWDRQGYQNLFICVNISRKDIYLLNLTQELLDTVRSCHVDPSRLHIDFSVEVLSEEGKHLNEITEELRKAGFIVNLDNFGSDRSSPSALKETGFDGLKLCRNLIRGIETDYLGKAITKAILEVSKLSQTEVTAEGIETERELRSLHDMGCKYFQGFFISEPIPVEEFETSFLKENTVYEGFNVKNSKEE